ncbi:type II toxin-antitoxin system Phd/YefM family antitoxin [Luteipulveratus sp. YIM 133132]|uniref:type II toxin-antitoxin system Phd/YefM family antitoxin n=1 Tax=Luteipulveratus flavus TaxID=3031728 RepID=UPI0023B1CFFF|nr:type II toxin-antitoxin system Phd/YefM family antitoxin [Luteipulveratus sp. YIM 133132]MDE9366389.1 type II toxin-antitoxin system Phd/YefM family antitoxin [Luteipulveratus sp. YIM 133132]
MRTLSISAAKARLNELVDDAQRTHEQVTLTKNGSPAAVMVAADEWEAIQETLFWQSQPGFREDLAQARRDVAEGETVSGDDVRARYGLPPLG